jgi:hypothetical protein
MFAEYPTAWKQKMDLLFVQLKAFSDDQEMLSGFQLAVTFAKYAVGHRVTRFLEESESDVITLKELQREIISVECKLRKLRTLRLRESIELDALALLLYMEDKVFGCLAGYKSALDAVTVEKR